MTPSPQSSAPKPVSPALAPFVNDTRFFGHPRGLSTLFMTEMWERFSYYGLRPLLVLFMAAALNEGGFGLDRTQASAIVGIYAASVYLASLPGGWIADRWLGLRRAILIGAALITTGHLAIGVSGFAGSSGKLFFFLGLACIVLGTGSSSRTSRPSSVTCIPKAAPAATPASRSSTWASTSAPSWASW